jgi:hypothetical protein
MKCPNCGYEIPAKHKAGVALDDLQVRIGLNDDKHILSLAGKTVKSHSLRDGLIELLKELNLEKTAEEIKAWLDKQPESENKRLIENILSPEK